MLMCKGQLKLVHAKFIRINKVNVLGMVLIDLPCEKTTLAAEESGPAWAQESHWEATTEW